MKTIDRYIFRRLVRTCLGSTLAIVALVWTTQAVGRIDFASGSGGSFTSFLTFMTLLIPQFIAAILPFGIVIGCIQVLNTMNADSEMPVLASASYGRWRAAKPIILIGCIASAYTLFSNHLIEPYTNKASRDVLTQARADLLTTLIQPGRFTKADDGLVIFVDDKSGNVLERIMISDTRDPELSLTYYAKGGAVGEVDGRSLLIMQDGEIHRKTLASEAITAIRFQSYAIDLSQFSSADAQSSYFIYERSTAFLLNPDQNDRFVKSDPGSVSAELHRRMTDWLYPVLMSLVALVIAGQPQSHRTSTLSNYFLGFGAALIYRGLSTSVIQANKLEANSLYLLYAIPLIGIVLSALMYSRGIQIVMPQSVLASYDRFADRYKTWRLSKLKAEPQ